MGGSTKVRRLLALLFAALLALAACGDDDGDAGTGSEGDTSEEAGGDGDEGEGGGDTTGDCAGTSVTGTNPSGGTFTATHAAAASLVDGAAYTLYLADFEVTTDSFSSFSNPEAAEGESLWIVAVTIFNAAEEDIIPIEVGEVVEADRPFGELTFTAVAYEGETPFGNSMDAEGTVTVTAVGDTFCGTIDYTDAEKSISGTFEAPTKGV